MEDQYISKTLQGLFTGIFLMFVFLSCAGQHVKPTMKTVARTGISGRYQQVNGNEVLFLNNDKTFTCLKNHTQKSDVVTPACDTSASGYWEPGEGFVRLRNSNNFNKIDFEVAASEAEFGDSVYFKIILPEEDALNYKSFKFSIITSPLIGQFVEADKPAFAVPKTSWGDVTFGLVIHNIAPVCDYGAKSYQRIYFNVFEGYKPKNSQSNVFAITLKSFNQCFYEAMDIDGEIIGLNKNDLFWRGNVYRKIK